jgi:hypothetical protein
MSAGLATTRRTVRLRLALDLGDPVGEKGLGRGHHHLVGQHLHRQHLVALGVGRAHGVGHLAHVDLERIDAQVREAGAAGEPLREHFEVERLVVALARHRHVGQAHQRRLPALGLAQRAMVRLASTGEMTPSVASHSIRRRSSSGPFVAGGQGCGGGAGTALMPEVRVMEYSWGLNTRSHLGAGQAPASLDRLRALGKRLALGPARACAAPAPRCCLRASA